MDSGNSGSMQSSSGGGGDEEYESRGESFTSFLNPSSGQFGSISDHHLQQPQPQPQPPQQPPSFLSHQYQNTLFNPNNSTQNLESQYGNDIVWSRGLSSSQNNHHQNFENLIALSSSSSSSSLSSNQSLFGTTHMLNQPQFTTSSSMTSQSIEAAANNSNNNPSRKSDHPSVTNKNPKKRTRASRRAPTTVLPTDTTNFRQMVQQFTGIPTAPFSSTSSSPYARRQDLLFSGGGGLSGMRSDALNLGVNHPLYPLRPSAQKIQISPFLSQIPSSSTLSSTMIEALMSSSNQSNNAQSSINPLNMQNHILSFNQSALMPTNSSPVFGTNSSNTNITSGVDVTPRNSGSLIQQQQQHGGVTDSSSFDDFGMRHENINSGNNYNLSDKGLENVSSTVGPWISPSDH